MVVCGLFISNPGAGFLGESSLEVVVFRPGVLGFLGRIWAPYSSEVELVGNASGPGVLRVWSMALAPVVAVC